MGIRPGEERLVRLGCSLAFFSLAMNVLVLAAVTALFLGQRGRSELPLAYGAAALFGLAATFGLTALSGRVTRVREASIVFGSLAGMLTAGFVALPSLGSLFLFVLYPVSTSLAALCVVQAFAVISDCVDPEQAKRLLPLIGSGGTLGAMVAGGAIAIVAPRLGTRVLLLLAAGAALSAIWLAVRLVHGHVTEHARSLRPPQKRRKRASSIVRILDDLEATFSRDRLVFLFAVGQCLMTMASTLLRFEFESALQTRLPTDTIAVFLGLFNLAANACVLLVQTLLERSILRHFGLSVGLGSLPVLFLIAMPALWLGVGLWAVAGARFAEHVLRFSLSRTSEDLVLLPLSSTKRRHTKTLVVGALTPGVVLFTSGLLLASSDLPGIAHTGIAFGCGGAALWIALNMRHPYLLRLQSELSRPRLTLDSIGVPPLHGSHAAVASAMERTLREVDPRRVAFALRSITETRIHVDAKHLRPLYASPDASLREAAYLTAGVVGDGSWLEGLLEALEHETDETARTACARALYRHVPDARLAELDGLLLDPASGVRAEALARRDTLACLTDPRIEVRRAGLFRAQVTHAPALLAHVIAALGEPSLAGIASEALRAWPGEDVVRALSEACRHARSPALQKRAMVALGRRQHPDAQATLIALLDSPLEDTRSDALRALVRQRRGGAGAEGLGAVVQRGVAAEIRSTQVARVVRARLRASQIGAQRVERALHALDGWSERCERRLFLWLALAYPPQEMLRAQLSFARGDRRACAFALEVLGQRLEPSLRRQVTGHLALLPAEEHQKLAERALGVAPDASVGSLLASIDLPIARWLDAYCAPDAYDPGPGEPSMPIFETMFALRSVELFSRLTSEELRAVAELSQTRRLAAGETLFREGEPGDAFFVIKTGEVEVQKHGQRLASLREGDWFGELALLDRGVRTATIIARSELELTWIGAEDFHQLLDEAPSIARTMLISLARRQTSLLAGQHP